MASPKYVDGNVRAQCPDCEGALATFEYQVGGGELGTVIKNKPNKYYGLPYNRELYILLQCGGCGRGGLATVYDNGQVVDGALVSFYPTTVDRAPLPKGVPEPIEREYREAELCASAGARRGASALLRSTLEKTLGSNGYDKGSLQDKIDQAANDGIITAARQRRAHDQIRDLGNDVLHDEWREVEEDEYTSAHHYAQRILEDFYDQRTEVEAVLVKAKRLKPANP